MDVFDHLIFGFGVAISLQNLFYCLVGVTVGTLIGVLPGVGPLATIAMLLPITYNVSAVAALIMLAGIYYGAQYGGSTTAILVNLPGETSSIVTCIDGYQMARQGRAGPALAIAAIGSFFAGTVGTFLVALAGPPLAEVALQFGAPEYFSLMLMGLIAAAVLAQGDMMKSLAMVVMGLLLGIVGSDVNTGVPRFSFGIVELSDGIGFIVVAVGVFAVGEIVKNLGDPAEERSVFDTKVTHLYPTLDDLKRSIGPILRGTGIGSFFGVLPGTGPAIASFASYMVEKKLAADPSRFGKGAIEGVAGPESANNADAQCKFIPMLTLGLPASGVMALMLGALTIQGIQPGPEVMTQRPELYGACLPGVGVMDMLRFQKFTIGWAWTSDYGSSDDPEQFKFLRAYSPLQNIKSGTCYPPTLAFTADHDDRVVPGHTFKFIATLQAAQACPNPILVRIETKAGHGAGKPTSKQIDEAADRFAFLVRELHMKPVLQ